MPYKHAESRRHKFTKPKYKVTNWPEYNDSLRKRGDITIWFTEAAISEWRRQKQVHVDGLRSIPITPLRQPF